MEHAAFFFRVFRKSKLLVLLQVIIHPVLPSNLFFLDYLEGGDRKLLRNTFNKLPINTALYSRGM
jgi:hypothetical protein